jgi:hypothetical protein
MRGARAHKAREQRTIDRAEGSGREAAAFCLFWAVFSLARRRTARRDAAVHSTTAIGRPERHAAVCNKATTRL